MNIERLVMRGIIPAIAFALTSFSLSPLANAQDTPPPTPAAAPAETTPALPTVEERLADIEAYMNNVGRPEKANEAASLVAGPGPGANAWQMVSTALVLFMTLPGLALFYGGLVRRKNVLSVLAQCLGIACVVTPLWWFCGYSLSFGVDAKSAFVGDFSNMMFKGVEPGNVGAGYHWISDSMWAMFQLTFAIITPALIIGAIAERMKFAAILAFVVIWMFAGLFSLRPHGLVHGRLHVRSSQSRGWNQGDRFRRWHGGPHDLRLVRAGSLHHSRQAQRSRQGIDGSPQHGSLHGRHRHALGRLVWL